MRATRIRKMLRRLAFGIRLSEADRLVDTRAWADTRRMLHMPLSLRLKLLHATNPAWAELVTCQGCGDRFSRLEVIAQRMGRLEIYRCRDCAQSRVADSQSRADLAD